MERARAADLIVELANVPVQKVDGLGQDHRHSRLQRLDGKRAGRGRGKGQSERGTSVFSPLFLDAAIKCLSRTSSL